MNWNQGESLVAPILIFPHRGGRKVISNQSKTEFERGKESSEDYGFKSHALRH